MSTITNQVIATGENILDRPSDEHIVWLMGALLFFVLGLSTGWFIWKRFRPEAKRLERENQRLMSAYEKREKEYIEHKDIVTALIERQPGD